MPVYGYTCECGWRGDRIARVEDRDSVDCETCGRRLARQVGAPLFRFAGRVTPGGGPDRFTADMMGIPLKELPETMKASYDGFKHP